MRPGLEQARRWRPDDLRARAAYARGLADQLWDERGHLSEGRDVLGESWRGHAADRAAEQVEEELRQVGLVAGLLEDLSEVLGEAASAIDAALRVVLRNVAVAEADGFHVSDVDDGSAASPGVTRALTGARRVAFDVICPPGGAAHQECADRADMTS